MDNFTLVTGASTGIGRAFALEIANSKQSNLIITARSTELLEGLRSEILKTWANTKLRCEVITCDLSNYDDRLKLIDECKNFKITTLINNAGYGSVIEFSKSDINWELNMIALNCQALLHLSHYFAPLMAKNFNETCQRGKIINVSSIASFHAMPYMATYAATKAFVTSFSLALSKEQAFKGIDILALCPGPTQSNFHIVSGLKEKMTLLPGMTAEKVVNQALKASKQGKNLYVNGWSNFLMAQLHRIFSKQFAAAIIGSMLRDQLPEKSNFSSTIDK